MLVELMGLSLADAVAHARRAASDEALPALDRVLLQASLDALLDGQRGPEIGLALADAADLADERGEARWQTRWEVLLELLEGARQAPSAARDHELGAGLAGRLLEALARAGRSLQSGELAERLGCQATQVSRELARLDEGHLVRRRREGRAVWVRLTPRGRRVATALTAPTEQPANRPQVEGPSPWNSAPMAASARPPGG